MGDGTAGPARRRGAARPSSPPGRRLAQVTGTGRYVPERVVSNEELERRLGEPVGEWLAANVGIRQRHVMGEHETTSDLAAAAARPALARAGITAADLDLVIVATDTPDQPSPATASVVQANLGAVNAGMVAFNCAWGVAHGPGRGRALLRRCPRSRARARRRVRAYGMRRFQDWDDEPTARLFANGASAVVLRAPPTSRACSQASCAPWSLARRPREIEVRRWAWAVGSP